MIKDPVVKGIDRRREGKGIWGGGRNGKFIMFLGKKVLMEGLFRI